jgi:hypothetical protein
MPCLALQAAKGIGETCFQMYARMASGIAPENIDLGSGELRAGATYNIQVSEPVPRQFFCSGGGASTALATLSSRALAGWSLRVKACVERMRAC